MRLFDWLVRRRREDDLDDEIRAHLAMATRDRIDEGEDARAARLAAVKEFGNVTLMREATRGSWGSAWRERLGSVAQDVRFAVRVLARNPGYSLVVIAVLTLGVGANVAVFSLFKGLVIKPIPGVDASGTLGVVVAKTGAGRIVPLSNLDFRDVREQSASFAGLAGTTQSIFSLGLGTRGERLWGEMVTGNYFEVLGVRTQLGRPLLPSDDVAPGRHPVVVLSDPMWRRVFGADPTIVGKTIQINAYPMTVVGVSEPSFRGSIVSMTMDVFLPIMMQPQLGADDRLSRREVPLMWGLGRLQPDVSLGAAATQVGVVSDRLSAAHPERAVDRRATVIPMWQSPYGAQTYMLPAVAMMSVMGVLLLLIVCANIANLMLVRGVVRRGEIAARLALGASRGRILRLLLIESIVIAIPGALLGAVVTGRLLPNLFSRAAEIAPTQTFIDVGLDGYVVAFALLLSCGSAIVFGLAPALRSSRLDLASVMKDDLSPRGGSRGRVRTALVVAQVAVSLLLLVGVGLAWRSLEAARNADAGFDRDNVALVSLDVRPSGYDEVRGRAFYHKLLDTARADAGIESATVAVNVPLALVDGGSRSVAVEGYVPRKQEDTLFLVNGIGSGYFRTLRIPLLAGRDFDAREEKALPLAVIVNETMARRFWKTPEDAVGKRIRAGEGDWRLIVGVARDIKYSRVTESPRPHVYLPFDQAYAPSLTLHVRGQNLSTEALLEKSRRYVQVADPTMPILFTRMLRTQTSLSLSIFGMAAWLLAVFGAIAILLAALGTYGLVSYAAKLSTHEIGIRLAIGASRGQVARRFLGRGLRLGAVGALIGVVAAMALTRLLSSLLYGVSAMDGVSFVGASLIVLTTVFGATLIPAWRASRTDPITALRQS